MAEESLRKIIPVQKSKSVRPKKPVKAYAPVPKASYKDMCVHNGWAKVDEYKPPIYELVKVKDIAGKTQYAWWNGHDWDYGNKRIGEPQYWRNVKEYVLC
jgi:hypothetical protein